MKYIYLLLLITVTSNAESIIKLEQDNNRGTVIYCAKEYSFVKNYLKLTDVDNVSRSINTKAYQNIDIEDGYIYDGSVCTYDDKYKGLSVKDYNFAMSILGGIFGLSVFTLIIKAI